MLIMQFRAILGPTYATENTAKNSSEKKRKREKD
jgi:hypothetical protein